MMLELDSLDWADVGAWPWAAKALCHAMSALLALIVGYGFVLADSGAERARLQVEEARQREQLDSKQRLAEQLPMFRRRHQEAAQAFAALRRLLPRESEVPGLIEAITRAAVDGGLIVDRVELASERSTLQAGGYLELPIAVVVNGDYHELGAFAAALAGLPHLVVLHDFELRPAAGTAHLTLSATAKTYRLSAAADGETP